MSEGQWETAGRGISAAAFAAIALLIGGDLLLDRGEGAGLVHLGIEGGVLVLALAGAAVMLRRFERVSGDLAQAKEDAARWRRDHHALIMGLGEAIRRQFEAWRLTPAESEIGLLLLKGLSHKEIAIIRSASERTVREQSRALYRKAGLAGRNELSAFFLEDLLPAAPAALDAAEVGAGRPHERHYIS